MTDWRAYGNCLSIEDKVFFLAKGGAPYVAKFFCRSCTVREECLNFAMKVENGLEYHRHGVYGGLTPTERQTLEESGWKLGDPLPEMPPEMGPCPYCGRSYKNVKTHVTHKHKEEMLDGPPEAAPVLRAV